MLLVLCYYLYGKFSLTHKFSLVKAIYLKGITNMNSSWSCTNLSIRIWMTWHNCWRFWNTLHKKGSSYIFSHRLYSISAYGIDFLPHKLDIRRSKYIDISNTRNLDISLLVGLWLVYQFQNKCLKCPLLTLILSHVQMTERRKYNSLS